MNDKYNPKDFEEKLYQEWEEKGYFKPSMDKTKESYCIMMPPPNVTGKLHMGHALDDTIQEQQKKLGCSCDWDRRRFTLDEGLSDAVLEQFVDLYNKGLIYKGKRMINYCPSCKTSISDAEVEYKEEASHLWHIRYQITGEKDRYIIVATTRPETMLGDTAVAVHPDDERYKDLVGKTCILPIMNKEIPIIADEFVEREFGTGCVNVTPFGTQSSEMLEDREVA